MGEVDKLRIALETFCSTRTDELTTDNIPDELEKILQQIAQNGEIPWQLQWKQISYVVRRKILFCIHEMNTAKKYSGAPEEYTETMDLILSQVELFDEAPFTIQRVCELLINPGKHYTSTDKYMRALLKNLLVVSGWRKQPESDLPADSAESKKEESQTEAKIEPDSTSEGVSFGTMNSPTRRRDDSPDDDCDSTNQQPDSTTMEATKEEVRPELKTDENAESSTPMEEGEQFIERPKLANEDEDDIDVFESMKSSPKRKVALSNTKIQIQVGVGKGIPNTEEVAEHVSSTSPDQENIQPVEAGKDDKGEQIEPAPTPPTETAVDAAAADETKKSEKSDSTEATDESKTTGNESSESPSATAAIDLERKRKRSNDSSEGVTGSTSTEETADSVSTPQKLQKTE